MSFLGASASDKNGTMVEGRTLVATGGGPNSRSKEMLSWIREVLAACFWIYAIFKLFIFDVDLAIIRLVNPDYIWISQYKFFILIGALALIFVFTRSSHIIFWSIYISFYPIILIFIRLPYFLFKKRSWLLALAVLNAAIAIFRSFKYKFVTATIFLLSIFFILSFSMPWLLVASMVALVAAAIVAYVRAWIFVFQPSSVFRAYSSLVRKLPDVFVKTSQDKEIRHLPVTTLTQGQIQLRRSSIQHLVIGNRALLFFARRLR
jgi:hypothetical protein